MPTSITMRSGSKLCPHARCGRACATRRALLVGDEVVSPSRERIVREWWVGAPRVRGDADVIELHRRFAGRAP